MNDIVQNEIEIFMDVQDLVLQWVLLRSFEARPQLTTYFIEFLTGLLKKYASANLMVEVEKNLLICCCFQLYITCWRYVDSSYFTMLFQLAIKQAGCSLFLNLIEWQLKENKIIEEFHMDQILDILQIIINFIPGSEIHRISNLWGILINFCYHNFTMQQPTTAKCLRFLGTIYLIQPRSIEQLFTNQDDQVLVTIKHLAEKEKSSLPKNHGVQGSATRNEVIEEPGQDPYDGSDQEDHLDDRMQQEVDYDFMAMKGQMDGFLNNFLRSNESTAYKYMLHIKAWMEEPRMDSLISENANNIVGNLVGHLQQIGGSIETYRLKSYHLIVQLLNSMADNQEITNAIEDKVCFELFDTILFILINVNETKSNYKEQTEFFESLTNLNNNLNQTILKFISNGPSNMVYQTLFDLLVKCRESYVPPKFDGLVVKCIVKITQRIDGIAEQLDLPSLLARMHNYILLLKEAQLDKKDDIGVKVIKTVLNAIIERFDTRTVLAAYANSVAEYEHEDNSIKKWIHLILQGKKNKGVPEVRETVGNRPSEKPARRLGDRSSLSSNYGSNTNLRQIKKNYPAEEIDDIEPEEEDDELAEIRLITEKLNQPSLPISQLPKIIKELETALSKFDEEIDIEPFISDMEDKKRIFILRGVQNYYSGDRGNRYEMSDTKSRLSHSNMKEKTYEETAQKRTKDPAMEAKVRQYSLRHAASSKTMPQNQRDRESLNNSQNISPAGQFNRPARPVRDTSETLNEQARKIDELKKKMMGFK